MYFEIKFWVPVSFHFQTLVHLRDRQELQTYASKLPPGSTGLKTAQDALRSSVSVHYLLLQYFFILCLDHLVLSLLEYTTLHCVYIYTKWVLLNAIHVNMYPFSSVDYQVEDLKEKAPY